MHVHDFKDKHKGARIVVAGNGPSLSRIDLSRIDCPSFGVNGIFHHAWWRPAYYCAESKKFCKNNSEKILLYRGPEAKFIANRCREFFGERKLHYRPEWADLVWANLPKKSMPPQFSTECHQVVHHGMNVIYMAVQLAFYMGAEQVILIGVDFDYPDGPVAANHFYDNKLQAGNLLDSSNKEMLLAHYELAHKLFNAGPIPRIVNATPGTKLDVFPKIEFEALFKAR